MREMRFVVAGVEHSFEVTFTSETVWLACYSEDQKKGWIADLKRTIGDFNQKLKFYDGSLFLSFFPLFFLLK
jgi:hypothetical protein